MNLLVFVNSVFAVFAYIGIRKRKLWGHLLGLISVIPGFILFLFLSQDYFDGASISIPLVVIILLLSTPIFLLLVGIDFLYVVHSRHKQATASAASTSISSSPYIKVGYNLFYLGLATIILASIVATIQNESFILGIIWGAPFMILISGGFSLWVFVSSRRLNDNDYKKAIRKLFILNVIVLLAVVFLIGVIVLGLASGGLGSMI